MRRIGVLCFLTFALLSLEWTVTAGEWRPSGPLNVDRLLHTATLLPSGEVLIAGGWKAVIDDAVSSAELYDPRSGVWTETGSLSTPRFNHTATLLPSGHVLVVGGESDSHEPLSSVELYDPMTGSWTLVDSLKTARFWHTATRLPSGKVLVLGGHNEPGVPLASVEIYDPLVGTWESAASLFIPRGGHTATLLASGKVLVVSGSIAELYDPTANTWEIVGSLSSPRFFSSATRLASGKVLVAGGWHDETSLSSVEVYDPELRTWELVEPLNTPRHGHYTTLLPSGQVLVISGFDEESEVGPELYDPVADTWTEIDSYPKQWGHSVTLLPSGMVLVAGRVGSEVYDPGTGGWEDIAPPISERGGHAATLLSSGKVLVAGGYDFPPFAELYDPGTGSWQETGPVVTPRVGKRSIRLPSGKVLISGGVDAADTKLSNAELYDPDSNSWVAADSMTTPRRGHTMTLLLSGKVLVTGGFSELSSAELYDPETDTWEATGSLASPRGGHTATLLPSGEVLVAGGRPITPSAELYDPTTGTWRSAGSLVTPRLHHTATLLPSGQVLVAGGSRESGYLPILGAELWDPDLEDWRPAGVAGTPRVSHTALLLGSGKVLIVGGHDGWSVATLSAELYDPSTRAWTPTASLSTPRHLNTSTLLASGEVLAVGGYDSGSTSAELYRPHSVPDSRRPILHATSGTLRYGEPLMLTGERFRGDSEATTGDTRASAVNFPLVQIRDLEGSYHTWLVPDPRTNFWDDPMTLQISEFPPGLNPGPHLVRVITAGVPSQPKVVEVECSLEITEQPLDLEGVVPGTRATFQVRAQGARTYQWFLNGVEIPDATESSYTTLPIVTTDSGNTYSVRVSSGCMALESQSATLTVFDNTPPTVEVVSPRGGEYWLLSEPESLPQREVVTWSMDDDIRVCQVEVTLLASDDGGLSYSPVPAGGGLPRSFGPGGTCSHPGTRITSLTYTVPAEPPSGNVGSLYRIEVRATDHAGLVTTAESSRPFFIVRPNDDSIKTLIVYNEFRMKEEFGLDEDQANELTASLQQLAEHPQVLGKVVDLGGIDSLATLYAVWDNDSASPEKANAVLFGVGGVHDHLLDRLEAYTGVEYMVLVGDDRIVPMARIQDRTVLFPEEKYIAGGDLSAFTTTVGQALAANKFLSDDPLASLDRVSVEELDSTLFIPDLSLGRLVETPEEITATIATFISQAGVLDLGSADHRVQVAGYDFLRDSARRIARRWKAALGQTWDTPPAPVDSELIGQFWDEDDLLEHFCGNSGDPYGILHLNGHATHYLEGVPGTEPFDIQGLDARDIAHPNACGVDRPLDLAGSAIFSAGCHGGLSVAGSQDPADHPLDLPQTYLSRGALAYVANSGFGWGLKHGIGYGERLMVLLAEELSRDGTTVIGDAVKASKLRYHLESQNYDPYAVKSLMQWTFYGLPMVEVSPGFDAGDSGARTAGSVEPLERTPSEHKSFENLGGIEVEQRLSGALASPPLGVPPGGGAFKSTVPPYLTRLDLHFDLTAPGLYRKFDAAGDELAIDDRCPATGEGCYYALNGLSSGVTDQAIQPYFLLDSRLSGTSQHGVLWKGGSFDQETGWRPVIGELISNGAEGSNHGVAPRAKYIKPISTRAVPGVDPPACAPSDLEINSVKVSTGELLKNQLSDPDYDIQRIYRQMDVEILYYNNTWDGAGNCDRQGPQFVDGPYDGSYHQVRGATLEWAVPVSDTAGVWRVLVVYDDGVLENGRGQWVPLELADDGTGTWRGSETLSSSSRVTYMLQAVDFHGNVSWLDFESTELPSSGVPPEWPLPIDVEIEERTADLLIKGKFLPNPVEARELMVSVLKVKSRGPADATSVKVVDELPAGVGFLAAGGSGWSCELVARSVICTRDFLEANTVSPNIYITGTAPSVAGSITSTASVSAREEDPRPANNTKTLTAEVVTEVCPPSAAGETSNQTQLPHTQLQAAFRDP